MQVAEGARTSIGTSWSRVQQPNAAWAQPVISGLVPVSYLHLDSASPSHTLLPMLALTMQSATPTHAHRGITCVSHATLYSLEDATIKESSGNMRQVDQLINVLLHKENKDFDYFCVVLEKEGVFGPGTQEFVTELGRWLIWVSGDPLARSHMIQQISVAVQRGNAASVLGTLEHGNPLVKFNYN